MTSPDLAFPDGASGGNTVYQLQNVTQASVAAGQSADILNLLSDVWDALIDNLLGGFGDVVGAIGAAINKLISDLVLALKGVTGGFIDLTGFLNDTRDVAESGGSAGAAADAAIAAAQAAAAAVAAQGAQVQAVKAAVLSFQDGLPLQPFSHSMTNSEMTFDRVDVGIGIDEAATATTATAAASGAGSSGYNPRAPMVSTTFKTGDGNSSNGSGSNTFMAFFGGGMFTPAPNAVYGGFIRARWGGLRESFTFMVGDVSSPCSFAYIVGTMDDSNGNITIAAYSGDISASIGNSAAEVTPAIPDGVVLSDRETVFVAIHQYGSGNVRPLYGKKLGGAPRDGLLFPARQNARFGRSTPFTTGSVINASDLLFDDPNLPWLGVGLSLILPVPEPTSYYEDFDTGSIPSSIVKRSTTTAAIFSGNFGSEGGTDGERNYQITKRLNRDNHFVQGQIVTPTAQPAFLGLRADSSGYNRTVMAVTSSGVSIRRRGSSTTTLASASFTVTSGEVYRFIAVGNVYSVYRVTLVGDEEVLGSPLCQYIDSANALPFGVGNRWQTLGVTRAFPGVVSGLWSYVLSADIPD